MHYTFKLLATFILCALAGLFSGVSSQASDLHAGYYYPGPQTQEVYVSRVPVAHDAAESSRAAFVVGLAGQQLQQNHAPGFHLFAKGEALEKLIIVATGDGRYDTLYRMRALLASLTSLARSTPLFSQTPAPHKLNFLDFCKLMGFAQVTVSNGKDMAHRILIE